MSICRTTIMETHTKEDLDLMLADYIENFDSMFPEAELALSVRISPTTWINNSVYADQDTVESTGSGARQKFRDKYENSIKELTTHVGEVVLKKQEPTARSLISLEKDCAERT